jgi:PAS domain S-box-containing protein
MKILIIDDSPADRELAIRRLEHEFAGAEFVEIGRKPDLGTALAQGGVDAVLTDYRLHWADGLKVLKDVKALYPYVPVIFMTESGSEEIAVEGMKAGLSDYVLKQHPGRLPVALMESLEKARLRKNYDQALTDLHRAHDELRQAHEGLERRVEERTAELSRREAELAQANEVLRSEMAERRRVEEERERLLAENSQQRELLEHLIAAAPVGIAVVGAANHVYDFANPAYLAITGKPTNLSGLHFGEVLRDLADLANELLQPVVQTGQMVSMREFERALPGQQDNRSYWDLDAVPLHDASGNVDAVLLLINDVTQKVLARTQVEELALQLAAERRFLDSIMDHVPIAIAYLDQDLIYRQCNRAAAQEVGLPVEQVLGRHLREIVPGNPHVWEALADILRTGEPYPQPIIILRWENRPEAGERHYMVAYLPDKDETGRVRGVFAEGQDVTELVEARRKLEKMSEELRLARDQLDLRVQERTAELEAIFASLPDAVYVGDETGIQRCNQIALDNWGCQSIQDLRENIPALNEKFQHRYADTGKRIRPEDEAFARALRGQPWTYEMISRNLMTGADIIQRCAARPILRDGQVIGAVAINTDITEQKRAEETLRQRQQRLQILHEVDLAILGAHSPAAIAAMAMRELVAVTAARGAIVILFDSGSAVAQVLARSGSGLENMPAKLSLENYWLLESNRRGDIGIIEDVAALPDTDAMKGHVLASGIHCFAGFPLSIAGQGIGAVVVGYAEPGPLPDETQGFARQVTDQLAVAIHQARTFEELQKNRQQLRSLTHHLVALQESERKHLSRELHDRSGQSLTALMLGLGRLKRSAEDAGAIGTLADELLGIADGVLTDLHDLAVNLRPSALDRSGLVPAIEQYLISFRKQYQINAEFVATGLDVGRLPDELETAIYRILQESLTNVARHAQASQVGIVLTRTADKVSLIVEDDGQGFDVEEALARGRLGLLGMRERAEMLGGALTVESSPSQGTCIYVQIPYGNPA